MTTGFSVLEQKRAAAFVAMSVVLEMFDPDGDPHLEPFNITTKDEKIARALRLASEVDATPEEALLIKNFQVAIKRLGKGQAFTRPHKALADRLRSRGFHPLPRSQRYHVAMTAE
ncbi:MAG: hypothetical protein ABI972_26105 [Acidobacteriota bacterium]